MGGAVGIDDVDAAGKAEAGMAGGMSVEAACAVDAVDGYLRRSLLRKWWG